MSAQQCPAGKEATPCGCLAPRQPSDVSLPPFDLPLLIGSCHWDTTQHCAALHYAAQHSIALHYPKHYNKHHTTPHHTTPHHTTPHHTTPHHTTPHHTLPCAVLQCTVVWNCVALFLALPVCFANHNTVLCTNVAFDCQRSPLKF